MSAESERKQTETEDIPPDVLDAYREHARKWVRCPSCGAGGTDIPGVTVSVEMAESVSFSCERCGNVLDLSAAIARAAAEDDVLTALGNSEP